MRGEDDGEFMTTDNLISPLRLWTCPTKTFEKIGTGHLASLTPCGVFFYNFLLYLSSLQPLKIQCFESYKSEVTSN